LELNQDILAIDDANLPPPPKKSDSWRRATRP
jgi:hypothetical protein